MVGSGEGKGWAKGKTAATDERVAHAAAAHRGRSYVRRTPIEKCKWDRGGANSARTLALEWSSTMAYVVGLMATDGCLLSKRRQLNFKSEDRALVETFLQCLGRPTNVSQARTRGGGIVYFKQFGDAALYRWLEGVGLMPRKSLVLGPLQVPDELLPHCARGFLDGDGSLINYWYEGTGKAAGKRYEGFTTRFISASRAHVVWLQEALERVTGLRGFVTTPPPGGCWGLNFAIRQSCQLLPRLYPTEDAPRLERKWIIWREYARRHGHPVTLAELSEQCETRSPALAQRDGKGRFARLSRA